MTTFMKTTDYPHHTHRKKTCKIWSTTVMRNLLVLLLAIGISACTTTRKTLNFDTSAELNFSTSDDINPDTDNRPSPVTLQIFTLTSPTAFEEASFLTLYESPKQTLGDTLKTHRRLPEFLPESFRLETLKLDETVRYIGILAEYNQFEQSQYRILLPITAHKKNSFDLAINRLSLDLQ